MKIDLKFIIDDCNGSVEKAQRRIDRIFAEYGNAQRNIALEEANAIYEKAFDWVVDTIDAIRSLKTQDAGPKEKPE